MTSGYRVTAAATAEAPSLEFYVNPSAHDLRSRIILRGIKTLNVAGNRESATPGIFTHVLETLLEAFA